MSARSDVIGQYHDLDDDADMKKPEIEGPEIVWVLTSD